MGKSAVYKNHHSLLHKSKGVKGQGLDKPEDEKILEEAFDLCDHDKNGTICSSELGLVLRALGFNPTDKEVKNMVKEIDKNNSGRIEFHEFRAHYNKYKLDNKSKNNKQDILNAFRVFDKNGNGYIEAKELKDILRKLGDNTTDEQIQEMIQVADIDKDGRINYSEFADFICKPVKYQSA